MLGSTRYLFDPNVEVEPLRLHDELFRFLRIGVFTLLVT